LQQYLPIADIAFPRAREPAIFTGFRRRVNTNGLEAGTKLKSGLEDLKSIGKANPAQIIIAFNVECLPK
jgi:hypothetical protein